MNIWTEKQDRLLIDSYYESNNYKETVKDMARHFQTTCSDIEQRIRYLERCESEEGAEYYS